MKYVLVIVFGLFWTNGYSQIQIRVIDHSPLIGNIYRNYGAELHPDKERVISYEMFNSTESLNICTYHPMGENNREIIDSISSVIISQIYLDSTQNVHHYFGSWTDITESGFNYSGSDVYPYHRINDLPYSVYQKLYVTGINDSRDYFQEFLNITIKSICVDQLDLFDNVSGINISVLNLNDLVEILQEEADWVKIKSLKTGLTGWINDSCLE